MIVDKTEKYTFVENCGADSIHCVIDYNYGITADIPGFNGLFSKQCLFDLDFIQNLKTGNVNYYVELYSKLETVIDSITGEYYDYIHQASGSSSVGASCRHNKNKKYDNHRGDSKDNSDNNNDNRGDENFKGGNNNQHNNNNENQNGEKKDSSDDNDTNNDVEQTCTHTLVDVNATKNTKVFGAELRKMGNVSLLTKPSTDKMFTEQQKMEMKQDNSDNLNVKIDVNTLSAEERKVYDCIYKILPNECDRCFNILQKEECLDHEDLKDLTGDDLGKLGIVKMGHRKKLLRAFGSL